ncbi:MAG: Hpt domain-containing protein [Janthinobacterium lividum]
MSASSQAFTPAGSQQLLATVWQRNLPLLRSRLASLEVTAQHAEAGLLSVAGRRDAADIAHKLAGSLGMFGYLRGTEIARELELLLDLDGPVASATVRDLISSLGKVLPV